MLEEHCSTFNSGLRQPYLLQAGIICIAVGTERSTVKAQLHFCAPQRGMIGFDRSSHTVLRWLAPAKMDKVEIRWETKPWRIVHG